MMQKNFHEVDTSSGVAVHARIQPSSSPTSPSSSISTCSSSSSSSSGSGSGSSTLSSSSRDDTSSGCCSSWDDDPNQNEKASLGLSDMLLPHGDGETPRDLLFPAGRRIDVDAVRCHYGISTYAEMIDLFRNLFQSYPFHPGEYVLAYSILGLGDESSPLLLPVQPSDTILSAAGLYQVFVVSREVTVLPEGYDGVIRTNAHPRERY